MLINYDGSFLRIDIDNETIEIRAKSVFAVHGIELIDEWQDEVGDTINVKRYKYDDCFTVHFKGKSFCFHCDKNKNIYKIDIF